MRSKFYQNQLSILKKANKKYKAKLTERAGYDMVETYQVSLENSISKALHLENKQFITPISVRLRYSKSIL